MNIKPLIITSSIILSGCGAFTNNLHEAVPRTVYRSAQTDTEDLEEIISENKIRSVLNLRSQNSEEYADERKTCERLRVDYYHLRLSARRAPTRTEMLELLDIFDKARTPLHIHCFGGADRTGLAITAYRLNKGQPFEQAIEALDFIPYGHIENEIDDFFEAYQPYQRRMPFREWVERLPSN
ncbi:tyrosine-protein phosphatase [Candidatus Woesearchaeota archaeon]|nr:tyrosine-protein phosphatase [Candidatus Woesearchaeota archaeon]